MNVTVKSNQCWLFLGKGMRSVVCSVKVACIDVLQAHLNLLLQRFCVITTSRVVSIEQMANAFAIFRVTTVSLHHQRVEKQSFLAKSTAEKMAINFLHEAPEVSCHAEVSVCLCLSLTKPVCAAPLGMSVTSSFPLLSSFLTLPPSCPPVLPGSSSTYVMLYLRKQMSRGLWLSPVGVFRYLGACERVCVH